MTPAQEEIPGPAARLAAEPGATRRAVIDIGTNSVKLLVGEVRGNAVEPLLEVGEQTRLGAGLTATRRLNPDAIARTVAAVARLMERAHAYAPSDVRVLATAAARDAENGDELVAAVSSVTGARPEIVSGTIEAAMAFRGVMTDARLTGDLLVADSGGGSTELILGRGGAVRASVSIPLGAVTLHESLQVPDAPDAADLARCRARITAILEEHLPPLRGAMASAGPLPVLIGVGGTVSILARIARGTDAFDRAMIEATRFSAAEMRALTERLWALPIARRRALAGLPPERADIILTGAAIYEVLLSVLEVDWLQPSTRGVRFAALLDPA